ncbi:MAG: carboxypeptidase regulatory-like domain-containing protein, partial [Pedobacter sp.]
ATPRSGLLLPEPGRAGSAGTDTLRAELNQGSFAFTNLKEGVYKVWIKGNAPYKDATIENVAVKDSATTDLGEIKLQQ